MILISSNPSKQLVCVSYFGRVRADDFLRGQADFASHVSAMPPGFRLLADFSDMESMDADCVPELGRVMELISQARVALVVRVIPDPSKDIGMNILAAFHYPNPPRVVACETLVQAGQVLEL